MKKLFWSVILQWSRFGVNALVFLLAARVLTLQEFGTFATTFAVIKLGQGLHKAGIAETVVIKSATSRRLNALFGLSVIFGVLVSALYLTTAAFFAFPQQFVYLGLIPLMLGLSAVSDGLLRKRLDIRALALRTATAQGVAGILALLALYSGSGVMALVLFAVLNVGLSAAISIVLAGWFPTRRFNHAQTLLTLKTVLRISGRDVLNSGLLPISQIAVGLFIGLPAAGAFQIATRILSMLDALTLAPLRYIALPKLAILKSSLQFNTEINWSLRLSAALACWVWFGLASSTPQVLELVVGRNHAILVAPILQALIPLGLSAALTMPFTQALLANGQTRLVLSRAIWTITLSIAMTLPLLQYTAVHIAIGLVIVHLLVLAWFLSRALSKLSIQSDIFLTILPSIISGLLMFAVVSATTLGLGSRILLGSAIYIIALAAFHIRPRWSLAA